MQEAQAEADVVRLLGLLPEQLRLAAPAQLALVAQQAALRGGGARRHTGAGSGPDNDAGTPVP